MTRTDRYVLREALVPLILSLLIATIMIILLQLQQELGGAGRSGMSPDLLGMRILRALRFARQQWLVSSIPMDGQLLNMQVEQGRMNACASAPSIT